MTTEAHKYQSADRGCELLNRVRVILEVYGYSETDVAFACAEAGGQAIAMASKDNPEAFAENVERFKKAFYASAEYRFAHHDSQQNKETS